MISKVTKKQNFVHTIWTVYFWKYILRVNERIIFFLNETSILVFAELANFHSIYMRRNLGKLLGKSLYKS